MMELRPFQVDAVNAAREAIAAGDRRVLIQAATGAGKTIIASRLMQGAEEKKKHVLFLAHRRELIYQCSDKLNRFGVPHGIIMAGEHPLSRFVQVASLQTVWTRSVRLGREPMPPCDLMIVDECHRSLSPTYLDLINAYPEAVIVGLSATPARSDGRGLGEIYDRMVSCPRIGELIDTGYLVPLQFYAPTRPDLEGVRVKMGDYIEKDLGAAMDKPELVGDVVEHWLDYGRPRKTVVFASTVAHSIHLCERFTAAGVKAAHIDAKTDKDERRETLKGLSDGRIEVICNCQILTEGFDQPDLACAVLARPTKSLVLFLQMVGRVMRPWEGKDNAIILDHSGAIHEHGFPEEMQHWSLDPSGKNVNPVQQERQVKNAQAITCEECFYVYTGRPRCPNCGHQHQPKGREVSYIDGRLGEVLRTKEIVTKEQHIDKQRFYSGLLGYAHIHGYNPGWAAHAYKEKFGNWPNGLKKAPLQPDEYVMNWAKHLQIKAAKRRRAA